MMLGRGELARVLQLLEERHGVGMRGAELPRWLEQRLSHAVAALLSARKLEPCALLPALEREPELVIELANALRVGETRFYRDPAQWEALRRRVVPQLWQARRASTRLLGLSAGCSSGEEAWTLAMLLYEGAPRGEQGAPALHVLGVDRSEAALTTARSATYDRGSQRHLPRELAQRFLSPAVDGSVQLSEPLRSLVSFQCRDLNSGAPPGHYSLIVCKNVLIYFGAEAQERLVGQLLRALADPGVLLVARAEVPIVRALGACAEELAPHVTAFRAR